MLFRKNWMFNSNADSSTKQEKNLKFTYSEFILRKKYSLFYVLI